LRDRAGDFEAAGARVVLVGLGGGEATATFRREERIPFLLLVDPDRVAYRAARLRSGGITDLLRPSNVSKTLEARRQGFRQGKTGAHPMQLGGSFVLGPGNRDLLLRPARTFGDNASPQELLAALSGAK
jgi:hypothetical protein